MLQLLLRHIASVIALAAYLVASGIYVGTTQGSEVSKGSSDSAFHVAELDGATHGIVQSAESRTIASGPSRHTAGGGSHHGSVAILKSIQHGITSWIWQYGLYRNDAPIHFRKEDLIYPFHYYW